MRKSMVLIVLCSSAWLPAISQACGNSDPSMQNPGKRVDLIRTVGGNSLRSMAHARIQPAAGPGHGFPYQYPHLSPDILAPMPAGDRVASISQTPIAPQKGTGNELFVYAKQSC